MILRRISTGMLVMLIALPLAAEPLTRPAGLERDIAFWRQVFAELTSKQALVHDNRNLSIVYATVDLPNNVSTRKRRRIADQTRNKYKAILKELARGKRNGLTTEQKRVLELWPDDVTNGELRAAAGRIRFQQGLADRFRDGLRRSGRWEKHIRDALSDAGVPVELASLPHVESSYNPAARSHVGASGLWQFTRDTGRRFMQIDHVVDERRDPYVSSDAAAALLKYNYSILQSWPLAITAYNHGVAGMRRAVRQTGTEDIEVIVRTYKGRAFGFASRNFYVAFLAANEVAENAEKYFGKINKDDPVPQVVVELDDYVAADTLAQALGVSDGTLREYNPALLKSVWTGLKYVPRGFELRLPADDVDMDGGEILAAIPNDARFARQTPDLEHRVERGDSLSLIAARYDTSVSELMTINNLRSRHKIRVGQVINLPYKAGATAIPADADVYIVRSGDTISEIATRAGVKQSELLAMNSLASGNRIYAGQQLIIRAAPAAAASASPTVAEPPTVVAAEPAPEPVQVAAAAEPEPEPEPTMAIVESGADDSNQQESGEQEGLPASAGADSALLADPSDYLVSADGTIEIQAAETLGHFADWLDIKTQRLRDANGYAFRQPAVIGHRIKLVFDDVDADEFASKRIAYHRELQEAFFARYRIVDTKVHKLRSGESLFVLSLRRYKVPVWLLRQYNPDLDIDRLRPGTEVIFPQIELSAGGSDPAAAMANAAANQEVD
ncbi:MAG: LysM peptidoglycan-binding domain-containing protein [Gammaproteobacteria bacterium]|nr:LysM peptidoglycan-binding domain-containing protein [Gammaproteobacteria bacterium]MBT8443384.1 LysM peptidoglycan-binding domain-containing protein [Gammaproteobacteria bacterium]NND35999.1 LysM peptidoglycan-binding domain-containing protein [Gammaproteobacteria bacterium]